MNIFINSHNHVTSTIWSEYVSEQIRTSPSGARSCLIGITRVGSSEADPTKNMSSLECSSPLKLEGVDGRHLEIRLLMI